MASSLSPSASSLPASPPAQVPLKIRTSCLHLMRVILSGMHIQNFIPLKGRIEDQAVDHQQMLYLATYGKHVKSPQALHWQPPALETRVSCTMVSEVQFRELTWGSGLGKVKLARGRGVQGDLLVQHDATRPSNGLLCDVVAQSPL